MSAARTSRPRRLLAVGGSALFVILGSLLLAQPAAAHGGLYDTNPDDGAVIDEMPETVDLEFTEAMQEGAAQIDVIAPSGTNISTGDAEVEGAIIRQQFETPTETGVYTVNWRAAGVDGHVPDGTFTFTLESVPGDEDGSAVPPANDETTTAQPSKKPVTTPTLEPSSSSEAATTPETSAGAASESDGEGTSFGEVLPWLLLGAAGIAVLGGVVALLVSRARGGADRDGGSPAP
ncbi:copper resistance CopC family protein [Microbacterium marinilacus]|uniref:CopC domain-containing protein n=1 Tax=Microbacterium marinilacus TaxID=415209 RepID=A0ABP7B5D5_9MICO|nr:copper resistance protein CopC [Microbacterium marinilacus]MBY0687781.1 copper resistance protein CopC [Microbacterium marinilacus]